MTETVDPLGDKDPVSEVARTGFDQVHSDPAVAEALLSSVVADPAASAAAQVIAHWGLGRLHHDSGQLEEAARSFERAISFVGATDADALAAQITMSHASTMVLLGDHEGALQRLSAAEPQVSGALRGRLLTQRAYILTSIGRTDEAILSSDEALRLLRADGDAIGEMRMLLNRGVTLMQLGRLRQARHDLEGAAVLAETNHQDLIAAMAAHNLGYVDFLLGRFPSAMAAYAAARARYAALGTVGRISGELDADECRVLLAAGLANEALEIALRLAADALANGHLLQQADAELLASRAQVSLGAPERAAASAARAAELFRATGRAPWAAMADYIGAIAGSEVDPRGAIPVLRSVAATMQSLGWPAESAEVLVRLGTVALAAGDVELGREALTSAATVEARAGVRVRAAAWHARALLHLVDDEPAAARRAIDAGLRVVDRHRASLGASELRVRAAGEGVELAELGVRLAMRRGRPNDVLVAAERWRAGSLFGRASVVGDSAEVDHDLAELRRVGQVLHGVGDGARAVSRDDLQASTARLERRITAATRLAAGDPRAVSDKLDVVGLRAALGDAVLVEYIDLDGELHAVVVDARRTRLVHLPQRERAGALIDHALFSIRRLAGIGAGHPRAETLLAQHERTIADLDAILVAPLGLAADEVVVVPTGVLHAVPWSALPSLHRSGGLQVAPSAAWWVGDDVREAYGSHTVLVQGPDLPSAEAEVRALAELHASAAPVSLFGREATVAALLAAMEDTDLVHLAAHGAFRADNPMFSSLRLADGLLYVHDLHRLASTPRVVVLTACSAARAGVFGGDELLGTSIALLAMGVRSVIAPLLPVRDVSTKNFSIDLHRALAAGATPHAALGAAVERARSSRDPGLVAASAAFLCIGRRERRRSGALAAERLRWA